MPTIFRYTLVRFRGQIFGWGLALLVLGFPIISTYDVVIKEQEKIKEVAGNFAPLIAAMGGDLDKIASPSTYLTMRCFTFMPLILGLFAVLGGSGLLVSDEENGTLDLVLAHPVSRTGLFTGRLLAFVSTTLVILAVLWIGLFVPMRWTALKGQVSAGALLLPILSLLAVLLLFGTLALLLSMVLPSRRMAAMATGIVLVGSFFVTSLARVDPRLERIAWLSPLNYYQSGDALLGLNGAWFGGLLAVAVFFAVLAWWCFECRDIRVAGEGGWRWPLLRRRAAASPVLQ
jgi:ABC-2 type transport system permease protein